MTGFLGIDHPLIVVKDIALMRERYEALGFTMTPIGQHPWGTSTSLAMFNRCLLELMSIYDEDRVDLVPAGAFRFGRTIRDHLAEREGISLLALNSDDAVADGAIVEARGIVSQGVIEFGRDLVLPDGTADRTATTLKILHDPELPRLSNFICQQHRPDLIYVPKWLEHPNGTAGICQVTIMAEPADQPRVRQRLIGLHGNDALIARTGGFGARTGNGMFVVADRATITATYGALQPVFDTDRQPCCVAIHVRAPRLDPVIAYLHAAGAAFVREANVVRLTEPGRYGNVFLAFDDGSDA
jgi:hypothetical protein